MLPIDSGTNAEHRFPWRLATTAYTASYGLSFFFLSAFFWDDWATKTISAQAERQYWKELGFPPPISFILIEVLQRNPIYFHLATFFIFFACGWLLFQILKKVYFVSASDQRLITILFLILPINSARVAMQMFGYTYCLFFFYAGWYFLVTKRGRAAKFIAVVLFLLSFNTLSLITFLTVPAFHYLMLHTSNFTKFKFRGCIGPILLLLIAPSYWFFVKNVYPPSALHRAYYSPTISGIIRGLLIMLVTILLLGWTIWRFRKSRDTRQLMFALGLVLIALGAFPYITSGRLVDVSEWMLNFVPRASDWESRNQLLLGIGAALLITGLVGPIDSKFKKNAITVVIGSCVFLNFTFMQGYMLDAKKQEEVIHLLSNSDIVREGDVIMINDLAVRYNARGRLIRTYEWNGMLNKAFGDTKYRSAYYEYIDCNNSEVPVPDVLVTIDASNGRFKSLLTNNIGINMTATKISPCTPQQ